MSKAQKSDGLILLFWSDVKIHPKKSTFALHRKNNDKKGNKLTTIRITVLMAC